MSLDPWKAYISGVRINVQAPAIVEVEITPTDKALIAAHVLHFDDLEEAYKEAIERGEWTHYKIIEAIPGAR